MPDGRGVVGAHARLASQEEHEHETTDLQVVEVVQRRGVDPVMVDVGAVERPRVAHVVPVGDTLDRRVTPRDGDVVEEDVGVGMTAESGDVAVEDEAAAGIRAAAHDEHAHALGQLGQGLAELLVELEALGELGEAERRLLVTRQRLTARRAEVGTDLVLMAAAAASHGREGTPARAESAVQLCTWSRGRGTDPSRELDVESLAEATTSAAATT